MKKAITSALIISGTVLSLFVLNLILFMTVPGYRGLFESVVPTSDDNIPVVYVNKNESADADASEVNKISDSLYEIEDEPVPLNVLPDDKAAEKSPYLLESDPEKKVDEVSDAPSKEADSKEKNLTIIGREYHEDCGTGKGYWVITYSDGSTDIEE